MKNKKNIKKFILALCLALEYGIIGIICFTIGYTLAFLMNHMNPVLGGIWCMASALVVLQSLFEETLVAVKERVIGSLFGSIIAMSICSIMGYTIASLFTSILISTFLIVLFGYKEFVKISAPTAGIIAGIGIIYPDYPIFLNGFMRFIETSVGVVTSVSIIWIILKLDIKKYVNKSLWDVS